MSRGDGLRLALLTGFGTGRSPVAPGTVGTLPGVVIGALLGLASAESSAERWWLTSSSLAVAAVLFGVGVAQTGLIRRRFDREDPAAVVLDEIVGYLIALGVMTATVGPPSPLGVTILFAAFRAFDILKPPPIDRLEELPGALGVMADDALAGVYAGLTAAILVTFVFVG